MLCSERRVAFLCRPSLTIQVTKPSSPSTQEGQFTEELEYYIGINMISSWSALSNIWFTPVKQMFSHRRVTTGFGEAGLMESGNTFCSTSGYCWGKGRLGSVKPLGQLQQRNNSRIHTEVSLLSSFVSYTSLYRLNAVIISIDFLLFTCLSLCII